MKSSYTIENASTCSNPTVSIVIATYNRCEVLVKALSYIETQSMSTYEIIVIDNGPSTDGTHDSINIRAQKDNRYTLITSRIKGVSHARNIGCKIARGEYVIIMDDDYFMTNIDTIQYIYNIFRVERKIGILGIHSGENGRPCHTLLRRIYYTIRRITHRPGSVSRWGRVATRTYYLSKGKKHDVMHVKSYCMAIRRDVLVNVGLFPLVYSAMGLSYRAETELCIKVLREGYRVVLTTEVEGFHYAAERPKKVITRDSRVENLRTYSRNNTLFTLRMFWSTKSAWIFIIYDIIIGNRNQPGVVCIIFNRSHAFSLRALRSSIRGKVEGYKIFKGNNNESTI